MEKQNPTMQWGQTEQSLLAALLDLQDIYAKVHFADMGELPEGINMDDLNPDTTLEKGDISEKDLFFSGLSQVYGDLNYAWVTRHIDMEKAEREGGVFFSVTTPTDGVFAALVPELYARYDYLPKIGDRPVSLTQVRIPLQIALQKLTTLCYLISLLPGVETKMERPKGLSEGVESEPLDEAEFERRLVIIYGCVNEAWNSRHDKEFVSDPGEVRKRRLFPCEVVH